MITEIYSYFSAFVGSFSQYAVTSIMLSLFLTVSSVIIFHYIKRLNATSRYQLLWCVMALILFLPLLSILAPSIDNLIPSITSSQSTSATLAPVEKETASIPAIARKQTTSTKPVILPPRHNSSRLTPASGIIEKPEISIPTAKSVMNWRIYAHLLATIYILLAAILLIRVAIALFRLTRLKATSSLPGNILTERFIKLKQQIGYKRQSRLLLSHGIKMPVATGYFKPVVMIPGDLVSELSKEELDAIMIHELAHLERRDDWSKLLQRIVEALLFFSPAVHWLGQRLEFEREVATDERVVRQTGRPKDYARCLTRLYEYTVNSSALSLAPGVMMSKKMIFRRFEMILKSNKSEKPLAARVGYLTALGLVVTATVLSLSIPLAMAIPNGSVTLSELGELVETSIFGSEEKTFNDPVENNSAENNLCDVTWEMRPVNAFAISENSAYKKPELYISQPDRAVAVAGVSSSSNDDNSILDDVVDDVTDVVEAIGSIGSDMSFSLRDNSNWSMSWTDDRRNKITIRCDGVIEFTSDDKDIKSISPNGSIEIYERNRDGRTRLIIESDSHGQLEYFYSVDRKDKEFDEEGRKWLAVILETAIRNSGLGAEQRVNRILSEKGVDGVLDEIKLLKSDYIRRIYYNELLSSADLETEHFARIIDIATKDMDSDYEKAELLISVADNSREDPDLTLEYVQAVRTIESDYEARRVLSSFSWERNASPEVMDLILAVADDLDSDYEKAELLIEIAPICRINSEYTTAYINSLRDVDSDYETRRVLNELGSFRDLDIDQISTILELASEMDSDYEKAELFIDLADHHSGNEDALRQYIKAASSMESSYETRRVLDGISRKFKGNEDLLKDVFPIIEDMESDYERSEMLIDLARYCCKDNQLQQAYLDAAERSDSDWEMSRTLTELLNSCELSDSSVIRLLRTTESIDSDYEKSNLIKKILPLCVDKRDLQKALEDAVETMSEGYEQDQLYAKIYKEYRKSGNRLH